MGSVRKIFRNMEIIGSHEETGRNEPKWGDLLVRWRETAGLLDAMVSASVKDDLLP